LDARKSTSLKLKLKLKFQSKILHRLYIHDLDLPQKQENVGARKCTLYRTVLSLILHVKLIFYCSRKSDIFVRFSDPNFVERYTTDFL